MARFILSAFSDEYAPELDKQIEGMVKNKVKMSEVRGVDGINVSDLTTTQAMDAKKKLDAYGIGVSAIGSPIGKIDITDPMDAHLDTLKHTCELADIFGTKRIRMFSFYVGEAKYEDCTNEVIDRMGQMLDIADSYGIRLCHENEKGIYGDTPERCLELLKTYEGRLGCVFDPANFIECGCEPYPHCFELLSPYMEYMHIKDCAKNGTIVPAGEGIGGIPEILSLINNKRKGSDFILTVEPHLRVFDGLSSLEKSGMSTTIGNVFATAEEAFEVAITSLRNCFPRTAE
ncbi:MAG: sugar phosphate isomerase/epimerase [Ruminococcaceae bacterium]|nr:sugar phosphate isomerase/epimerase [Oscillospiraceae bacterium]